MFTFDFAFVFKKHDYLPPYLEHRHGQREILTTVYVKYGQEGSHSCRYSPHLVNSVTLKVYPFVFFFRFFFVVHLDDLSVKKGYITGI